MQIINGAVMQAIDAWRQLLPPYVEVSAGPLLDDPPEITRVEKQSAGQVGNARLLEFSTGRAYAKNALSKLGLSNAELPMGADRAPVWPAGVTGSITHAVRTGDRHFAAAVLKTGTDCQIGIDAEYLNNIRPKNWRHFLTAQELHDILQQAVSSRTRFASAIWCVKEAAIKATGCIVDPLELQVTTDFPLAQLLQAWRITFLNCPARLKPIDAQTIQLPEMVLGAIILCKEAHVAICTTSDSCRFKGLQPMNPRGSESYDC